MIVNTIAGPIEGNRRDRKMWWAEGWCASKAFSGPHTMECAWESIRPLVEGLLEYRACYAVGYAQGVGYNASRNAALTEAAGMLAEARVERARQDLDDAVADHQRALPLKEVEG